MERPEPKFNVQLEAGSAIASLSLYFGAYFLFQKLLPAFKSAAGLSVSKRHHLLNVLVSLLNSLLQSAFSVWLFLALDGRPDSYVYWIRPWVVNFASYLVYDTICCLWYRAQLFKAEPGLVLHHAVVLFSLVTSLFSDADVMFYQVIATLCEVNSIHLHVRNALKIVAPHFGAVRWPNEFMNVFTFVTWRYCSSSYLVWQAYQQFGRRIWYAASWWMLLAVALFAINNVLFYTLVRGYQRDWRKSKSK